MRSIDKKIAYNKILNDLEKHINSLSQKILIDLDMDFLNFTGSENDYNLILEKLEKIQFYNVNITKHRFNRVFTLWVSKEKDMLHFMGDACTAKEFHMNVPISEEYGKDDFKNILDQYGLFQDLLKHAELVTIDGQFSITYTETLQRSLFKSMRELHPYCFAHTLHELLKLMMEWEWCYLNLQASEPIAKISHLALSSIGLSINLLDTSEVVKSLWALPDMYVAQYLKGQELSVPLTDPQEPLEFKLWAAKNGVLNFFRNELCVLYEDVVKWKMIKQKLENI